MVGVVRFSLRTARYGKVVTVCCIVHFRVFGCFVNVPIMFVLEYMMCLYVCDVRICVCGER
jgi:hypothetical protein